MIEICMYETHLTNKETNEQSWEVYNAVHLGEKWYIERLKPGDTVDETIVIKHNGICHTLYRLNDILYELRFPKARGLVQLTEGELENGIESV